MYYSLIPDKNTVSVGNQIFHMRSSKESTCKRAVGNVR